MDAGVLRGYSDSAETLIRRFEAISPDQLYQGVIDLLPLRSSRIADIGAGTGRDAAWLASKGHDLTAVEPVKKLRQAGKDLHGDAQISWLNDHLPDLSTLYRCVQFDVVLLTAVWQHLGDAERHKAMRTLATITARSGVLILSVRHGPGAENRRVFPATTQDTVEMALREGFEVIRELRAESSQTENRAAGVSWTWLAFRRT